MGSNLTFRTLSTPDECVQVQDLQRTVWGEIELHIIPWRLLLDLTHNGGLLLGAFDDDRLVGFVVGFLGTDQESPNRPAMARLKHTSHAMGVHPEYQSTGIGYRLKTMQRDEAVANGVRLVTWTYDPLQSRNANLNIRRLGVVCNQYIREYYGEMRDEINVGFPSDRFRVEWWVTSDRVQARLDASPIPLSLTKLLSKGANKGNSTNLNSEGLLEPIERELDLDGSDLLVEIPSDLDSIRKRSQKLALEWRYHTRSIFERAFADEYSVTDFIFLKDEQIPRSFYVLSTAAETG